MKGVDMKSTIPVPILNNEYKVIVCWGNPNHVSKVLKSYGHKPDTTSLFSGTNRGMCFYSDGCHPVIALPVFPKTPENIGTLAHEAIHAVEDIFIKIRQPIGGELFAHSVGAVVRIVLQKGKYEEISKR